VRKKKGKRGGLLLTVSYRTRSDNRSGRGSGGGARVDGDPDGAPATLKLAQGRFGVVNLQHDKLGELLANQERKKMGGGVLSFTCGNDGTAAVEEQRWWRCGFELERLNACAWRAKERRGSSRLSLYSAGRILGGRRAPAATPCH
jgi:hypothetical protein